MKKTINWQFWDWKSIFRAFFLLSFLSLVLVLVFLFPDWNRERHAKDYPNSTKGIAISIKPMEQISMGHDGNKTVVYNYSIRYAFHAKSKRYEVSEAIPATLKIRKTLNQLKPKDEVTIRYDAKNPRNCQAVF